MPLPLSEGVGLNERKSQNWFAKTLHSLPFIIMRSFSSLFVSHDLCFDA